MHLREHRPESRVFCVRLIALLLHLSELRSYLRELGIRRHGGRPGLQSIYDVCAIHRQLTGGGELPARGASAQCSLYGATRTKSYRSASSILMTRHIERVDLSHGEET